MATDRVAGGRAFPRARRLVRRLEPFWSLMPVATFSPAARRLLEEAERNAERVLHAVRGLVIAAAWVLGLFLFRVVDVVAAPWLLLALAAFVAMWVGVWRRLAREPPSFALRCALIVFDGYCIARGLILFQVPADLYTSVAGDLVTRMRAHISVADVEAITPPMLVFLALTGAFRLDPRLAVLSTAVALVVYVDLQHVLPAPPAQAVVIGGVIGFAGLLGANAARVLRFVALKASEERVLERYVPATLTRELARSGDPEGAARVEELSVLVADIRGFTGRAERLAPAAAVALLNDCFAAIVAPLAREGAVLDKYLGDGLLAFFQGPQHAERALRAGRTMLAAVASLRLDQSPLRIGVAVHSGQTLVGTIGAPSRREYTIIGDVVNVTVRLEEWNKRFEADLVVSDDALRLASAGAAVDGLVGPVQIEIRGREAGMLVHYLASGTRASPTRT